MGTFDPFVRCPECGSMLDKQKRCTKCRYSQRKSKTDEVPLAEIKVEPTGFILFLRQKIAGELSGSMITTLAFVTLLMICFTLLSLAFCTLGNWGAIIIPPLMAFIVVCVLCYLKIRQLCTVPGAQLAFWQKPLWDLVLNTVRGADWKTKFVQPDARVADLRSDPPGDQELLMLPELSKFQVLDLEGAPISDAGLVALRGLPSLKYLVIKNCKVSTEAVFRLQQSIPETWIWH